MDKHPLLRKGLAVGIILLFIGMNIFLADAKQVNNTPITSFNGHIIYVDDDNTKGPWDGSLEHPFQTIQDGGNHSKNGDTVFVFDGKYRSTRINKSISLIGEDRDKTIVNSAFIVLANWVNITGFTIQNNYPNEQWCGIQLEYRTYCNISDNKINNTGYFGIFCDYHSNHHIISNNIISNCSTGIKCASDGSNIIKNNIFRENSIGIEIIISDNNMVYGNQFISNVIGIHLQRQSDYNNITKNNISMNRDFGFRQWGGGKENVVSYNNLMKNNENVQLYYYSFREKTIWKYNYWDDYIGIGPKKIDGILRISLFDLGFGPLISFSFSRDNYDWTPVKEPYDIPGLK
jgi:parallel beta-helix repeat protein